MRRYLVVANQTLGGEHLVEKIQACLAAGPASFHIVAPATEPHDHAVWTEGQARELAQQRLEPALARFREMGAEVEGEVGDERPMEAISDVLRDRSFDEIILSTLPQGISRWLRQDLPHRAERTFDIPITHVVDSAASAARSSG